MTSSPLLGPPSPGEGDIPSCSPSRGGGGEGGHSPAKLSQRKHSALRRFLRTPSPTQGTSKSDSAAKKSKSWLGLHRIPNGKMEAQEKRAGKSLSVPDLIVYLDESRLDFFVFGRFLHFDYPNNFLWHDLQYKAIVAKKKKVNLNPFPITDAFYFCRIEKVERSPLKPLQSPNCSGSALTIEVPVGHRLGHAKSEAQLSSTGRAHSPGQANVRLCSAINGTGIDDNMEEGMIPVGYGSKSFCHWNEATRTTEDGRIQKESQGEQNAEDLRKDGGGSEPKEEENKEQKLYRLANELLQTERAYVARLHLLDQVGVLNSFVASFTKMNPSHFLRCRLHFVVGYNVFIFLGLQERMSLITFIAKFSTNFCLLFTSLFGVKCHVSLAPSTGVLLKPHGGGRPRLVSPRLDKKYLLQYFLHILLPQPVPATRPGKMHGPLVSVHLIDTARIRHLLQE